MEISLCEKTLKWVLCNVKTYLTKLLLHIFRKLTLLMNTCDKCGAVEPVIINPHSTVKHI